jgi:hypothetical protein
VEDEEEGGRGPAQHLSSIVHPSGDGHGKHVDKYSCPPPGRMS